MPSYKVAVQLLYFRNHFGFVAFALSNKNIFKAVSIKLDKKITHF